MLLFAVFAQRFTVIAKEYDHGAVVELIALQPREEASEFVVGVSDLSVVGMTAVLGAIRLRRIVGTVGVVQMQPEEKRSPWILLQPGQCASDALAGATVH